MRVAKAQHIWRHTEVVTPVAPFIHSMPKGCPGQEGGGHGLGVSAHKTSVPQKNYMKHTLKIIQNVN